VAQVAMKPRKVMMSASPLIASITAAVVYYIRNPKPDSNYNPWDRPSNPPECFAEQETSDERAYKYQHGPVLLLCWRH
jgi:hypothetical protein